MRFQSMNEIEKFSFEDCEIQKFEVQDNQIYMELEALIVRPQNSQNTNYTESYAGTTYVRLQEGRLLSVVKEGYRYYDANDCLISEVPDEVISEEETAKLIKRLKGSLLFEMEKQKEENGVSTYSMRLEFPNKEEYDDTVTESYELIVEFTQAIFEWDFYMNRVQR